MSPIRWRRQLLEIRNALRELPERIVAAQANTAARAAGACCADHRHVDDRSILDLVNRRDPEAQPPRNPGRSIRDIVDEIESRIEPSHGDDQSRNDLAEVRVAPARQGRIAALESRVSDLERTVQILSDRTHESSSQVAGPVLVTPDLPATILAGTPDTVLLSGDGASVEGPATTTGPSISDTQTDRP